MHQTAVQAIDNTYITKAYMYRYYTCIHHIYLTNSQRYREREIDHMCYALKGNSNLISLLLRYINRHKLIMIHFVMHSGSV